MRFEQEFKKDISSAIQNLLLCHVTYENNSGRHVYICEPYIMGTTKNDKCVVRVFIRDDGTKNEPYWKLLRVDRIKDVTLSDKTFLPKNHKNVYNEDDKQIENIEVRVSKLDINIALLITRTEKLFDGLSKIDIDSFATKQECFEFGKNLTEIESVPTVLQFVLKLRMNGIINSDELTAKMKQSMIDINEVYNRYKDKIT